MVRSRLIGAIAVVGLLAAPLAACSDSSVMHMRVGQCILLPEGSEETTATTLETTGCTREHDAEVFHIDITGERLAACDRLAREMRK